MRKITGREWRVSQYDFSSPFTSCLFVFLIAAGGRFFGDRSIRCFYRDACVVRESVSAGRDDSRPGLDATDDLHLVTLADAGLHGFLVGSVVGANHHERGGAI